MVVPHNWKPGPDGEPHPVIAAATRIVADDAQDGDGLLVAQAVLEVAAEEES